MRTLRSTDAERRGATGKDGGGREGQILKLTEFATAIARRLHSSSFSHVPLEDLEQDGQVGLIKGIDSYDPKNTKGVSLKVWCYHTIRHSIYDAHRRRNYRNETAEQLPEEDHRSEEPNAQDQVIASERRRMIDHAYRLLPRRFRIALMTRESGDRLRAAAKTLKCTESAVCVMRQQAQKEFASLLALAGITVRGI